MKGSREGAAAHNKLGAPSSADLLVCFPTRAHLSLMPMKPICSPARPTDTDNPNHRLRHRRRQSHHSIKKPSSRLGQGQAQASPLLWTKNTKQLGSDHQIAEPTSPKVTCAGQIKVVRPKASPAATCKGWQSVMEEIERIHNSKHKKKPIVSSWMESVGFKKEVMQFLTCLRRIRFDLRCFGAFPRDQSHVSSDDEDEDDDEDGVKGGYGGEKQATSTEASRTVFSKWFMVLQESNNPSQMFNNQDREERDKLFDAHAAPISVPPPNALLLMRCRSAPAKSWLQQKEYQDGDHEDHHGDNEDQGCEEETVDQEEDKGLRGEKRMKKLGVLMDEEEKREEKEKRNKGEKGVVTKYGSSNFNRTPCDAAKETWVLGSGLVSLRSGPLSRSRSWN